MNSRSLRVSNRIVPPPESQCAKATAPFSRAHLKMASAITFIRDKDLYTATNKCLQRLIKIMYTVFYIIGVYV